MDKTQIKFYSTIDSKNDGLIFYAVHPDGRIQLCWTGQKNVWIITAGMVDEIPCSWQQIRKLGIKRPVW